MGNETAVNESFGMYRNVSVFFHSQRSNPSGVNHKTLSAELRHLMVRRKNNGRTKSWARWKMGLEHHMSGKRGGNQSSQALSWDEQRQEVQVADFVQDSESECSQVNWILVSFVQGLFATSRGIVGVGAVSVGLIIELLLRAG